MSEKKKFFFYVLRIIVEILIGTALVAWLASMFIPDLVWLCLTAGIMAAAVLAISYLAIELDL